MCCMQPLSRVSWVLQNWQWHFHFEKMLAEGRHFVPWVSKAMMPKMQSGSQVRQKRDMENIEGRERKKKHKNVQQLWCQKKEQRGKHPNEVCC